VTDLHIPDELLERAARAGMALSADPRAWDRLTVHAKGTRMARVRAELEAVAADLLAAELRRLAEQIADMPAGQVTTTLSQRILELEHATHG
jgi:hypothetical protein